MIIYNITIQVEWSVHEEWKSWFKGEYLARILGTGLFSRHQFVKLLEVDEAYGPTYAVQLFAETASNADIYRNTYQEDMEKSASDKWGESVCSFHSIMEVIN